MRGCEPTGYRARHLSPEQAQSYEASYLSGYYRHHWQEVEAPLVREIFSSLHAAGVRRMVDFACGTGRILSVAEDYFPVTTGVDISDAMLAAAAPRCSRSKLINRDITVRGWTHERVDLVTAFRFFLNAEPALRAGALRAIRTMLREGGFLVANVHVNRASPRGIAYRARNWVRGAVLANTLGAGEFETLLEAHGFRVQQRYWYGYLPRVGRWFPRLSVRAMRPLDRLCRRSRWIPPAIAECFITVAYRSPGNLGAGDA